LARFLVRKVQSAPDLARLILPYATRGLA